MSTFQLRPFDFNRDLEPLACLFSQEQDEPTSVKSLGDDYEKHKQRIFRVMIAEDEHGQIMGFNWAVRDDNDPDKADLYLIVKPEARNLGVGGILYRDVEACAKELQLEKLTVAIQDNCPLCLEFAQHRAFYIRSHSIGMVFDLDPFDARPYMELAQRLQDRGFIFTTMEELGNSEEAQRKLYVLNDTASSQTMGSEGEHSWSSFEDFQKTVCQSDWYKPAGQFIVIDSHTGAWVAMSAITVFDGWHCAYNLFTGVEETWRGQKLAQAVKAIALVYARDVLKVKQVRTHHNALNAPMIAIDRKLGYTQISGVLNMEKSLKP